jgi:hypothetical protein
MPQLSRPRAIAISITIVGRVIILSVIRVFLGLKRFVATTTALVGALIIEKFPAIANEISITVVRRVVLCSVSSRLKLVATTSGTTALLDTPSITT